MSTDALVYARSQRLTDADVEAILAQAVDPDRRYSIEGWVLISLAESLLEERARCRVRRRPRARPADHQGLLFP